MKVLTAIPVYNEEQHLERVLREVRKYCPDILVVNDGSSDGTGDLLRRQRDLEIIAHSQNRGYGAALVEAIHDADIVSGSRYLRDFRQNSATPLDRREINEIISRELNEVLCLSLTDAFCGFKAYRREALAKLHITETGWGMPLQLWVQAVLRGLRIKEVAVPRIYLDPKRAFGGMLNDSSERLAYYRRVIQDALGQEEGRLVCSDRRGTCR